MRDANIEDFVLKFEFGTFLHSVKASLRDKKLRTGAVLSSDGTKVRTWVLAEQRGILK